MKAAFQDQFGSPSILFINEVERPAIAPDQILVRVHASPVTQGDRRLRAADFPGISAVIGRLMFGLFRPRNPIPGTMFAGRVVETGDEVTRFAVGDDVFGSVDNSAQAEYVAVAEDGAVARMPAGVDYAEAAAVPYGAATALSFLRDVGRVQPGDKVLIVGASGGVGRYAVQIARHLGAEVTGVCSERHAELVRSLGATRVIDYAKQDYTAGDATYDVIFDTSSGGGFRAARKVLAPSGRYLTVYLNLLVLAQMLVTAVLGGPKVQGAVVLGNQELTRDVADLLAQGAIRPVLAAQFPLDQVVEAHAELEDRRPGGEVMVLIGSPPAQQMAS
ncbi:Phenolphthiocerol synthesis polyketide synthase type I Pks15/1 [Enhygromyxa salina]|uniref:Phenolphthiocerol synthesis polyketide synthase type I Pks15/1 n=1 Tax=Enhygromyxa salina TaxID=215803 RepID=A0A2S9YK62_9BACT|nr:NAD(P)-dependent alcohol dehydrogenase [Enhygromyxa salina]PRQ05416.1 Phenolphthiocerol synthesis polyketide synthase type I Pks15/1 [Enhygromyxa salina]